MANLQSLIKHHNAKVLTDGKKPTRFWSFRYKDSCLLAGKCLAKCIVYKADVTTLTKVNSTIKNQMESLKLGLVTIAACLGTKGIQLIVNFLNTSGM